jgi:hypothetical protein
MLWFSQAGGFGSLRLIQGSTDEALLKVFAALHEVLQACGKLAQNVVNASAFRE